MADVNQRYIVQFKVITQAERELLNLTNALSNPIKNIGPLYVHFFNNLSGGFKQIHADLLLLGSGFVGAFQLISGAFSAGMSAMRPFISAYKEIVKEGREFTKAMVLVSAATGTGTGLFEKMAYAVADMGLSAKAAADGMDTLVRAGLGAKEALSVFPEAVKFAKAVGVSIDKTATLLVGAINAFRGEGLKAEEFLQTFAFAILKTRFNFETFSTAFAFGGAAAAGFGQNLKDTIAVMIKFYDLGIRASTVGTLLRELFTRLSKPTREAQLALLQYGITMDMVNPRTHSLLEIFKTLGPVAEDMGLATTVFGRRTAGMIGKLVKDVRNYRDFFGKTIQEMNAHTQLLTNVLVERLSTMDGQLDILSARWDTLKVRIYKALEPAAIEQLNVMNNALREIEDQIVATSEEITMLARLTIISFTEMAKVIATVFAPAVTHLMDIDGMFKLLARNFEYNIRIIEQFATVFAKVWYVARAFALSFEDLGRALGSVGLEAAGKSLGVLAKWFYEINSSFIGLGDTAKEFFGFIDKHSTKMEKVILAASAAMLIAQPNSVEAQKAFTGYLLKVTTGLDFMDVKVKGSLDAMYKDFKAITQNMADDAEALFEKMPEKSEDSFNKISLKAAEALQDIQKTYSGEGGLGAVVDKLVESADKFGPKVAEVMRNFANRLARPFNKGEAQTIVQSYVSDLKTIWESETKRQGFFFGISSTDARKAIISYEILGQDIASAMVKSATTAPDKLTAAIIGGTAMTPEQEAFVKGKVEALIGSLKTQMATLGSDAMDIDKFIATGEDTTQNFSSIAGQVKALVLELENLKGAWNTIEGAMASTNEMLTQLDPELAKLVQTGLKNMQKELGISNVAFKNLAVDMEKATKAFVTADEKIRELDPSYATKFYAEIARGFKTMDPTMIEKNAKLVIDIAGRIKDLTAQTKTFGVEYQRAFVEDLKKAAATMTLPAFQQYLMNLKLSQDATEELRQSLLKYDEVLITTFALEKGIHAASKEAMIDAIMKNKELVAGLMERHDAYIKMSQKAKELQTELTNIDTAYTNALADMTAEGRAIWGAFATSVGSLMDVLSQRAVDSTVKIGESIKGMLRQIAAEIVKQTLVKGLFTAIFGGIFGTSGSLFKGLKKSIFGGQHGTTLYGVHGPGGTDNVPIMATPKEILLDKNASDAFREMIATGGSIGGKSLALSVNIQAMDGASVKRVFQKSLVPMINSQLRGNVGISSDVVFRSQSNLRKRPR